MAGMKSLTLDEAVEAIRKMPIKYAALSAIGITTGCRISEILALRRFDLISYDQRFKDKVAFIKLKSKTEKTRKLLIPADFQIFVIRLLDSEAQKGYERPDDYVFRGQNGKRLSRYTAYNFFRKNFGVGFGTHWMRKTFAQLLFKYFLRENTADPMRALELTRQALGHEQIDTTIKYLGIDEQKIDNAQKEIFRIG